SLADELGRTFGVGVDPLLGAPELHRERGEAHLRAVVERTLDALPLGRRRVDRASAAVAQVLDAGLEVTRTRTEQEPDERAAARRDTSDDPRRRDDERETEHAPARLDPCVADARRATVAARPA